MDPVDEKPRLKTPVKSEPDGVTPVMAQYLEAKASQPDALVFFRMGDFYELFFEDAVVCARAIDLALTKRGKHLGQDIAMCGVPAHTAETYISRLIRKGFKVAICDQLEDPREAKKRGSKSVVKRGIVRVVTPGTLTEDQLLDARSTNPLAVISLIKGQFGLCSLEISTGEVEVISVAANADGRAHLLAWLAALRPSETLIYEAIYTDTEAQSLEPAITLYGGLVQPLGPIQADPGAAVTRLHRLYGVMTLEAFGEFSPAEMSALGMMAGYIELTQLAEKPVLKAPRQLKADAYLSLDPATRASLEIERTQRGELSGSLVAELDHCVTAAGSRLLRARLSRPLCDKAAIEDRLDAVAWFVNHKEARTHGRLQLKGLADMARALGRLGLGRGGPRDMQVLVHSLRVAQGLVDALNGDLTPLSGPLTESLGTLESALAALKPDSARSELLETLQMAIVDEPPLMTRDGGFIRPNYNARLNEAINLKSASAQVVLALEQRLQVETGIALRIRYNAILGYFIEMTQKQAENLQSGPLAIHFIHRQSLVNQVRFTTAELMSLDQRIAGADAEALAIELAVFEDLRARILNQAEALQAVCDALSEIDLCASHAAWAEDQAATRPILTHDRIFVVVGGCHPVVRHALSRQGKPFTPNSVTLDGIGAEGPRLAIVTGPNMAGKSTFLRQNALLIIMAQAGLFVPVRSMRLGLVDRLYSRVGAGDDLAQGRSTFMMEMVETAAILNQASDKSFVIMDEIGRGTATFDGLAIAWASAEALHERNRCRTLFATHYHEMAKLGTRLDHVANLSLTAHEHDGDLIFLHEVQDGAVDRSFGVQVARLAGMPSIVVTRARKLLERLESDHAKLMALDELPLFAHAQADTLPQEPSVIEP